MIGDYTTNCRRSTFRLRGSSLLWAAYGKPPTARSACSGLRSVTVPSAVERWRSARREAGDADVETTAPVTPPRVMLRSRLPSGPAQAKHHQQQPDDL